MTTQVTAAQIAKLRRMVDEPLTTTYSDAILTTMIEDHPLIDELGSVPYTWSIATDPPTKVETPDWIATYDLNITAAEIWDEKAAALAELFSFSADGGNLQVSDKYSHALSMAAHFRSRRAIRTHNVIRKD